MIDLEKERRDHKKINVVFLEPDDKPTLRPFCGVCRRYMVYSEKRGYLCTSCGMEYHEEEEPASLENKYSHEPIIAAIGKRKRDRSDFPAGAYINEDIETSATGEQIERILDNEDV